MTISEHTSNTVSRHWLRMPAPDAGDKFELFIFSGIAIFDELKGANSQWRGGEAFITANYANVISQRTAILLRHWTVDVHLASIANQSRVSNNIGWAVDGFSLVREKNSAGGGVVAVPEGRLRIKSKVAVRDKDAIIHRLSYHVTILGKIVDWSGPIID